MVGPARKRGGAVAGRLLLGGVEIGPHFRNPFDTTGHHVPRQGGTEATLAHVVEGGGVGLGPRFGGLGTIGFEIAQGISFEGRVRPAPFATGTGRAAGRPIRP